MLKKNFNNKANIELMAPVGSFESMMAAINAGCDSIFFGITQLNMRAKSSKNFNFDDLKKIVKICHSKGVKTYLTLNTVLYNHDLKLAYKIIDEAKKVKMDAVIASDMAAILYANKIKQTIHLSTQMSVSNIEMVKFYAQYCEMIVLARELTLPMVKKICQQIEEQDVRGTSGELIKIEIFGHGAICIAVSGRCHMSLLTDNSSANRGACTQTCRKKYLVKDMDSNIELKLENNYVMSPTDLCTIGLLDEVVETGIKTIKIEGRSRSPQYVNEVISCYREALDTVAEKKYTQKKIDAWNKRLKTVYNRGMSGGFYMGKPFIEWSGANGNKATTKREQVGVVKKYFPKISVAEVEVLSNDISNKDKYLFTGETTGVVKGENPVIWLDGKEVGIVKKGDIFSMKVNSKLRSGDRLYKLMENKK